MNEHVAVDRKTVEQLVKELQYLSDEIIAKIGEEILPSFENKENGLIPTLLRIQDQSETVANASIGTLASQKRVEQDFREVADKIAHLFDSIDNSIANFDTSSLVADLRETLDTKFEAIDIESLNKSVMGISALIHQADKVYKSGANALKNLKEAKDLQADLEEAEKAHRDEKKKYIEDLKDVFQEEIKQVKSIKSPMLLVLYIASFICGFLVYGAIDKSGLKNQFFYGNLVGQEIELNKNDVLECIARSSKPIVLEKPFLITVSDFDDKHFYTNLKVRDKETKCKIVYTHKLPRL